MNHMVREFLLDVVLAAILNYLGFLFFGFYFMQVRQGTFFCGNFSTHTCGLTEFLSDAVEKIVMIDVLTLGIPFFLSLGIVILSRKTMTRFTRLSNL